ncbi:MAG: hypothetical protein ACI8WB_004736 [Phenylobacterium sp.]|jgi:hypothetical protein
MREYAPQISSATLSARLHKELDKIAAGFAMPKTTIVMIFALIFGDKAADELSGKLWSRMVSFSGY